VQVHLSADTLHVSVWLAAVVITAVAEADAHHVQSPAAQHKVCVSVDAREVAQ
jgi:hypothetical protein